MGAGFVSGTAVTAGELREHATYLCDVPKLAAYETALKSLLNERRDAVLDLGSGSGVLGLIAARAGARVVYAVESGPIVGPATEVAQRSRFADSIVHIRGLSSEIELPERVDVAVCDQIGGFVHDAGVLGFFADVRRRLLAPDGVLVPAGFRLFVAPAECANVRDQIDVWESSPAGFDSVFRDLAVNTEYSVDADQIRLLGPGVQVAEISSDHTGAIKGGGVTTIDFEGRCDGLVGWFEADVGGGATLTNHPSDRGRMRRWCTFYPTTSATPVERGDTVETHADVRPLLHAVTWRVTVTATNGTTTAEERHSTLFGQFLAPDDLARAGGSAVAATPIGRAVARMLDLADGTRSTGEVMAQLQSERLLWADQPTTEQTLRSTLERFSTPIRRRSSE